MMHWDILNIDIFLIEVISSQEGHNLARKSLTQSSTFSFIELQPMRECYGFGERSWVGHVGAEKEKGQIDPYVQTKP